MQAQPQVSVHLSTTYKGRPRRRPVWVMRYRLPSGKDSKKTLGRAWKGRGRPPRGFLTKADALVQARAFTAEHCCDARDARRRFAAALDDFMARSAGEKSLRGSTLHEYRRIGSRLGERPWRGDRCWRDRPLDTFTVEDLLAVRRELVEAQRSANTVNHYRRVIRGVFGVEAGSPAFGWEWMADKAESEGKLSFYTPEQVRRLIAKAHTPLDAAVYTLATEAGPRLSEIRALKVANVDFEVGVLRFEDGFTTRGGHAGNKGRRVRSVPMSDNVRAALLPFCYGRLGGGLVFEHELKGGEPICGTGIYRRFVSAARKADLPRLRLHDLRHTFGTQAIRVFRIHEVQRMMGHRHITTTERYLHYSPDADGAAKLSALWAAEVAEPPKVVPLRRPAEAKKQSRRRERRSADTGGA
jgi:integrase